MHTSAILLVSCPDRKGIVASIADFIFKNNGNILSNDEHGDAESNLFLTRVEFDIANFSFPFSEFDVRFAPLAREFQMTWRVALSADRPGVAIFVSKYDHCLQDLLYRHQNGELHCEIPLIISNHPDNQRIADFYHVPYFVLPVTKENKREVERQQFSLVRDHNCSLIVLARYMQVLSGEFISTWGAEHLINWELASTAEFRQLLSKYKQIQPYMEPPFVVESIAKAAPKNGDAEELNDAEGDNTEKLLKKTGKESPAKSAAKRKDVAIIVEKNTPRELRDHVLAEGKKDFVTQRYKGLGEMNSSQLWETTMDPERRTLLSVKLEDIAETDHIFTTLMGEDVEARRKFIEDNALDVKNLDI